VSVQQPFRHYSDGIRVAEAWCARDSLSVAVVLAPVRDVASRLSSSPQSPGHFSGRFWCEGLVQMGSLPCPGAAASAVIDTHLITIGQGLDR